MVSAPYSEVHKSPNGPGDARPTAQKVIDDQGLRGKLLGKTILITGCTSGIGVETARALYSTGAHIYITARQVDKGKAVAKELSTDPDRPVQVVKMELDCFGSVKAGAADFLAKSGKKLNVLVANAGVMACPESRTKDGFELQFGTNHLGHFLLFQLLKEALLASSTDDFASRVVAISSNGHRISSVHIGNYNLNREDDPYDQWVAYGQSKTANVFFANEIERRYASQGLHGLSLHPGAIYTELGRHVGDDPLMNKLKEEPGFQKMLKSAEQGAATTVWAAVGQEWEGRGGRYLNDVQESTAEDPEGPLWRSGHAPHAYDTETAKVLWDDSLRMVGMDEDK